MTVGVFLWVLFKTMSSMSFEVGTLGISFQVNCILESAV